MHHTKQMQEPAMTVLQVSLLILLAVVAGSPPVVGQSDQTFHVQVEFLEAIPMTRNANTSIAAVTAGSPTESFNVIPDRGPFVLRAMTADGSTMALQQFDIPERRDGTANVEPTRATVSVPYAPDVERMVLYRDGLQQDTFMLQEQLCSGVSDGTCSPYCNAHGTDPDCETSEDLLVPVIGLAFLVVLSGVFLYTLHRNR